MIIGVDAGGLIEGVNLHITDGAGGYNYWGKLVPTDPDAGTGMLGVSVDPGIPGTEMADGERPVAIVYGQYAGSGAEQDALYMYDLVSKENVATLAFDGASADIGFYGMCAVDPDNNRVYFTARNGGDSTIGYATYTVPVDVWTPPPTAANVNWALYE
jgi:hypothetical protein